PHLTGEHPPMGRVTEQKYSRHASPIRDDGGLATILRQRHLVLIGSGVETRDVSYFPGAALPDPGSVDVAPSRPAVPVRSEVQPAIGRDPRKEFRAVAVDGLRQPGRITPYTIRPALHDVDVEIRVSH